MLALETRPAPLDASSAVLGGLNVSLIVPVYNEEQTVANFLTRTLNVLGRLGVEFEIVVVDDGSIDATRERAASVAGNPHVRVVGYPVNQGKGWAAMQGMQFARGNVAVFIDGDSEVSLETIGYYLQALKSADIAIASKRHSQSRVQTPVVRRFLSFAFNVLVQLTTGIRCSDTQAGLKAFRVASMRRILPLLSVKRYAYDVEFLTVALLLRMKVVELPVSLRLGALFSARQILRIFVDLMGIVYRLRVRRWYQANLSNPHARYRPLIRWLS